MAAMELVQQWVDPGGVAHVRDYDEEGQISELPWCIRFNIVWLIEVWMPGPPVTCLWCLTGRYRD